MSYKPTRRIVPSERRRRRQIGPLPLFFLLVPLAVGCSCCSGVESVGKQEVRRPQPAPVQVARRTPRVNAFGYPIYEPMGPLPLEAAQSIDDTIGRSESEIMDFFGPPTVVVRDGDIRILRYRGIRCSIAFFLYLDAEGRRVVAFGNHERHVPIAANVRSCLLSLARVRPTRSGAGYIEADYAARDRQDGTALNLAARTRVGIAFDTR